ncbi:hypothetical protein BJV78DRAFT_1287032 [Lactifluus subvellereus]|nr:hypothetical protein BJV78DRAFT_1287032 [Lactifluus subvellereus]
MPSHRLPSQHLAFVKHPQPSSANSLTLRKVTMREQYQDPGPQGSEQEREDPVHDGPAPFISTRQPLTPSHYAGSPDLYEAKINHGSIYGGVGLTDRLLLAPSANAFWRLPCAGPVLNARVDPIVSPGIASGHAHTIMGSDAIGLTTTFDDLRNSDCTTCKVKDDKSAYWVPELFYQYKNGSFQAATHGGMLRFPVNETVSVVQAFPDGLRMLAGNPYLRNNTGTLEAKAITWNCLNFHARPGPQTSGFPSTNCPDGLRAQVFFPSCWDGVNLDSPDHKSHMAYPDRVDSGICPLSHPIRLISIFYEVYFSVAPFNALNEGGRFVLSNGDPTGYGLHGDFMNGWDRNVLSRAVATCTADSGVIEDCPVFQNEGRFETDSVMNTCAAKNPFPNENVSPGTILPYLPGCIAVTDGPGTASAKDLVPGCVPEGGSAAPISNTNPSATSSSAPSPSSVGKALGAAPPGPASMPMPSNAPTSMSPVQMPSPSSSSPAPPPPPTTSSMSADHVRVPATPPVSSPTFDNQGFCHMPPANPSKNTRRSRRHHAKRAHWSHHFD